MDSFRVFTALSTQWRPAYSGVIGFDYTAIHPVLRLMNIKRAAWADIFDDLRSMEQVAKKIINKGK